MRRKENTLKLRHDEKQVVVGRSHDIDSAELKAQDEQEDAAQQVCIELTAGVQCVQRTGGFEAVMA